MPCKNVQAILEEAWTEELSESVRAHLALCPACAEVARNSSLLRASFLALREEPIPATTLGFASRLVRRLKEGAESAATAGFLEQVGRRVVFATLLLALTLFLVLAAPSSGPMRAPVGAELDAPEPEVLTANNDPLLNDDPSLDLHPAQPKEGEGSSRK